MAKRRILPIETVPLVGGALCLNFINTTGARDIPQPRERLRSYRDLMVFCARTKLLEKSRVRELLRVSERAPGAAGDALANAIDVRELIYRLFVAAVRQRSAAKADVARFNKELSEASRRREFAWIRGVPRWIWAPKPADLEQMLGPILFSAAELLASPDLLAVKQCGACVWLFIDSTRNRSRRWCKKLCGDRVKSHRYYLRHRGAKTRSARSKENRHA